MRIKILLIGDDPKSLVADELLLRERGILVFTTFNLENIEELVQEVKPDLLFFDPLNESSAITAAYNNFVNGITHIRIPVIFTLSEDDIYLVTKKRTESKNKRTGIASNIIEAVKMALSNIKMPQIKQIKMEHPQVEYPLVRSRAL
jgi:response regulator RpfG family c-di-GMP phosphodiesterase